MSSFTDHKKAHDETSVWYYFLIEKNGQLSKCKNCLKEIKCNGGSTSGLHTHLKTIHGINLKKKFEVEAGESNFVFKQPKITNYFKNIHDEKLTEILARMISLDGLSFNFFIRSDDMRELLKAGGFKDIPKSLTTIKNMVFDYYKMIKQSTIDELIKLKSEGKRFSIILNECTSNLNRHYIMINVHSVDGLIWNIGLTRIHQSYPPEKCLSLIEEKLKDFNLDLMKDIVGMTTDDSPIMIKLGKLIQLEHQQCMAQCINLAINDVLYNSITNNNNNNNNNNDNDNDNVVVVKQNYHNDYNDNDTDDDYDYYDEDDIDTEEYGIIFEKNANINTNNNYIKNAAISSLISKILRVIKIIKNLSLINDDEHLRTYIKKKLISYKEKDCQTKWTTMLSLLEKFNKIKFPIQKILIDIGSDSYFFEEEFNLLSLIDLAFFPIKLTIDVLCQKDANLLKADASLTFMLNALSEQKSTISFELLEALKSRISTRRTELSQILQYLQKGSQDVDEIFERISKFTIIKKIVNLTKRLFYDNIQEDIEEQDFPITCQITTNDDDNGSSSSSSLITSESSEKMNELKKKLQAAINETLNDTSVLPVFRTISELEQKIKDEINFLEKTGTKGILLRNVYNYLMTIMPTTTTIVATNNNNKSNFSGYIQTKIQSSDYINDKTLDCLCFLRSYFIKKRNMDQNANS